MTVHGHNNKSNDTQKTSKTMTVHLPLRLALFPPVLSPFTLSIAVGVVSVVGDGVVDVFVVVSVSVVVVIVVVVGGGGVVGAVIK